MSQFLAENKFTSEEIIEMEEDFGAHNYHPLDVVFEKGFYLLTF